MSDKDKILVGLYVTCIAAILWFQWERRQAWNELDEKLKQEADMRISFLATELQRQSGD